MDRRSFLTRALPLGAGAALFGWLIVRRNDKDIPRQREEDWEKRVVFVCCDDHGAFSPGVYMRVGGGRAAFEIVREAAPYMRAGDPGSAAAGLSGFLFKKYQYDGETGGTLALEPGPEPQPDGTIDWKKYCSDCDVIVINVDQASAKCCAGSVAGQEIHNLRLGGMRK